MILNLRNLNNETDDTYDSFVCHGKRFTSHTKRQNEYGYMDAMSGQNPSMDSVAYRQGYLEFLVNEYRQAPTGGQSNG